MYENRLNTAKQLNLSEKSWYKLAKQFAFHLYDSDTKNLNQVQNLVENWKDTMKEVRSEIHEKEAQTRKSIAELQNGMKLLKTLLETDTLYSN